MVFKLLVWPVVVVPPDADAPVSVCIASPVPIVHFEMCSLTLERDRDILLPNWPGWAVVLFFFHLHQIISSEFDGLFEGRVVTAERYCAG